MKIKMLFTALVLLALLSGCVVVNPPAANPSPALPDVSTADLEPAGLGAESRAMGTFSEDAYFEHGVTVAGDLTVAGASNITGATTYGADMVFEGATADAYETTFAITDPTADRTITFPNSAGTVALNPYGASIEFEGATADAYELTLDVVDPTADVTVTIPKVAGTVHVDAATQALVASTGALSGKLTLATWLNVTSQTPVVVTAGSTITPTGTLQPLTSTGVVAGSTSNAIANGTTAGDLLILRNANAADAITIDGTGGNVECKTDKALGAQDTLTLIWNGSDWVCLSTSDNS